MHLLCLSVSHHDSPVELRECLTLTPLAIQSALTQIPIHTGKFEPIVEMVFLSTCNRLEIYAIVSSTRSEEDRSNSTFQLLLNYVQEAFEIPADRIEPYVRFYSGTATVEHLFQVAAGLDSIAIGETQILGQVSQALEIALTHHSARHILASLFRSAIHAGKRVRTETEIGRRPISISSIAVQLAENALGTLVNKKILVIGAGKMGGYALQSLKEHGVEQIILTNRTHERAAELVTKYGGVALPYEQVSDGLKEVDVVFTSTAAPLPILPLDSIVKVMSFRPNRPLTLIDLAVPRNVETRVGDLPNVQLFDMDDLQRYVTMAGVGNHQNIAVAKTVVAQEVAAYEKLMRVIPFIGELHKKGEQIRQYEVARARSHLTNPGPEVLQQIDLLSKALVRKLLHEPTMHLRTETDQETLNHDIDTLMRLFDLDEHNELLLFSEEKTWIH